MSLIPIKFRVVEIILQNNEICNQEILERLKKEYPKDRGINEKTIESYLLSLRAVGLIELGNVTLDHNGVLKQDYTITEYGANRMKHIG